MPCIVKYAYMRRHRKYCYIEMNARNIIKITDNVDKIIYDRLLLQRVGRLKISHQNNKLNSLAA